MRIVHAGYSDLSGGASKASYRIHTGLQKLGVESYMVVSNKMSNEKYFSRSGGKKKSNRTTIKKRYAHGGMEKDAALQ